MSPTGDRAVQAWLHGTASMRGAAWRRLMGDCGVRPLIDTGVRIRNPSKVIFGDNVWLKERVVLDGRSDCEFGIRLGDGCIVRAGTYIDAYGSNGFVLVGDRTGIGQNVYIGGNGGVTIGSDVMISGHVYMVAANHQTDTLDGRPFQDQGETRQGISIEDGAWVAAGSIVLDGVTIGEKAVVAAGSVVTKSVAARTLVAGVPARAKGDVSPSASGGDAGRIHLYDEPAWRAHVHRTETDK